MSKKHVPVRTCVGCREREARSDLLRFVARVDDTGILRPVPDTNGALPGRGAWVHNDPKCINRANERSGWKRAFRSGAVQETATSGVGHVNSPK